MRVPKLSQGQSGDVVARIRGVGAKKLAQGRSLRLSTDITVTGDGEPVTQRVSVKAVPK